MKQTRQGLLGLAYRRKAAGFTQESYADALGVGRSLLAAWEVGRLWPSARWLPDMAARGEFRLLMCHHPEYFARHIAPHDIDLTVAGHCHGGQVRIGHQGLYAPGQGILPKLTSGFYLDRKSVV